MKNNNYMLFIIKGQKITVEMKENESKKVIKIIHSILKSLSLNQKKNPICLPVFDDIVIFRPNDLDSVLVRYENIDKMELKSMLEKLYTLIKKNKRTKSIETKKKKPIKKLKEKKIKKKKIIKEETDYTEDLLNERISNPNSSERIFQEEKQMLGKKPSKKTTKKNDGVLLEEKLNERTTLSKEHTGILSALGGKISSLKNGEML